MSTSRKKKQKIQAKSLIAFLLPTLGALLLLVLILSFGNFTATRPEEKVAQRRFFFWYDKTYRPDIIKSLHRLHRPDLIKRLFK